MEKALFDNLKWIFSGIGVVLIIAAISFIKRKLRPKPKEAQLASQVIANQPSPVELRTEPHELTRFSPTPIEIVLALKNMPLLQQEEHAKHYSGIEVDWPGELYSIERIGQDQIEIYLTNYSYELKESACFSFKISTTDAPGIGLLKKGDPVRVRGVIEKVSRNGAATLQSTKIVSFGDK